MGFLFFPVTLAGSWCIFTMFSELKTKALTLASNSDAEAFPDSQSWGGALAAGTVSS